MSTNARLLGFALLGLAGLALLVFIIRGTNPMNRVDGYSGLAAWLENAGEDLLIARRPQDVPDSVGLLILPVGPAGANGRPVDLRAQVLQDKISAHNTLVIATKWAPEIQRGRADPAFLQESWRIYGLDIGLQRSEQIAFVTQEVRVGDRLLGEALIYAPQIAVEGPLRTSSAPLVPLVTKVQADFAPTTYHLLRDPDLLNNHGLALGENAQISLELVRALRQGPGPIVIDLSAGHRGEDAPREETQASRPPERERGWSDLARFFFPPFTPLWLGLFLLLVLALWRGGLRLGPALTAPRFGLEAKRELSLAATASLLRVSREDTQLLARWASAQVRNAAARVFVSQGHEGTAESLARLDRLAHTRLGWPPGRLARAHQACMDLNPSAGPQAVQATATRLEHDLKELEDGAR